MAESVRVLNSSSSYLGSDNLVYDMQINMYILCIQEVHETWTDCANKSTLVGIDDVWIKKLK